MLKDSSFVVSKVLENNGTIEVSGESTLNIEKATGNSITALDGAVIKDSIVKTGIVIADGNVTFKGDNVIDRFSLSYYNHNITIEKDASLTVTSGSRTTLSYGNTITVKGSIENAKDITDKSAIKKSLDIASGFSLTGNATANGVNATLDVENAYVSFGSTTSKNNAATGNFVMNFNNSIVDFTKDFQTAASTEAGLVPKFELNITDCVVNVANRFAFSHENSFAVVDNSIVTIVDRFKNAGTFTLQNGSQMSVGGNSDGPAFAAIGNSGTFTITGAGTKFDMYEASKGTYGFLNLTDGVINVNDGGTFYVYKLENFADSSITVDGGILDTDKIINKGVITIKGNSLIDDKPK